MKPGIHPEYGPVVFRDRSSGDMFLTGSTLAGKRTASDPTIEWSDGNTYPVIDVDISASSHPFWTGRAKVLDTEGRVAAFERRYGSGK